MVKQNTILPQIIFTFVIKTANLAVKIIRPDIILKNTTVLTKRNSNMLHYTKLYEIGKAKRRTKNNPW